MKELDRIRQLSANSYRLLKFLEIQAGETGHVYGLTREYLMNNLNISEKTVDKAIKECKDKGFLETNGYKKFYKIL